MDLELFSTSKFERAALMGILIALHTYCPIKISVETSDTLGTLRVIKDWLVTNTVSKQSLKPDCDSRYEISFSDLFDAPIAILLF